MEKITFEQIKKEASFYLNEVWEDCYRIDDPKRIEILNEEFENCSNLDDLVSFMEDNEFENAEKHILNFLM